MKNSDGLPDNTLLSLTDIAATFKLKPASSRVVASRLVKSGVLVRLKNNLYLTSYSWQSGDELFRYKIANMVQVPSYISLLTALSWHQVTSQIPQNVIESIGQKRTYNTEVDGYELRYHLLSAKLYFGFTRQQGAFMANKEKALADCIYLSSLGRYSFDLASLDRTRIDEKQLDLILKKFPAQTIKWWLKYGRI